MIASRPPWNALVLLLAACGSGKQQAPAAGAEQFWDYGVIPHGKAREHDFVIDTRALGKDLVPLGLSADCSCARAKILLRDLLGHERETTGQPLPQYAAQTGEVLVVRLQVDTVHKEAVDQPPAESRARVILQPAEATTADHRVYVPLRFRFGIDSPVKLQPFAMLDFGRVPMCSSVALQTTLRSDLEDRKIAFGPASSTDPRLTLSLEQEPDGATLHARLLPAPETPPAPFQAVISVNTDLPDGYVVRIPVSGRTVPDLEATPVNRLTLGRLDFEQPCGPEHFVIATDHDRRRPAAFVVASILDQAGHDASAHFAVRLEPVPGDGRSTRVYVRYAGGLTPPEFRGKLTLAKDKDAGPFLPIELTAFHFKTP